MSGNLSKFDIQTIVMRPVHVGRCVFLRIPAMSVYFHSCCEQSRCSPGQSHGMDQDNVILSNSDKFFDCLRTLVRPRLSSVS